MDRRIIKLLILCVVLIAACGKPQEQGLEKSRLNIVTTTGMIEDAVMNIVGDSADVISLMGPGVDPHLYKATQGDLQRLTSADVIFYNGLHLEGKMGEVLEKLSRIKPVIAVAEDINPEKLRKVPEFNNNYDPHIWFDVALWTEAVRKTGEALQDLDSARADFYRTNTQAYVGQLDSLHKWVKDEISTIPKAQRTLITAHDAFGYFGDAYDIEVRGLQGISTLSEYGLRDVSHLVTFIVDRKIKAVFVETSVSEKAINAVVEGARKRGFDVKIGGNLYSDAMGKKGTKEGTYIGMVTANVNTIVEALK
ncbi:Manganese ABC transporter, periplasmic-binding protein SitA [Fulvivirga imtechensis AK7]|uniref:Manganese ABC transporter, periplasmic-binding protein SitA n=1 Tax=Fulvivirga imtechensis AK7 TaxID=1237149 RepID=L8JN62_9BACT|nr:zinc ABC transporter substrate-binding protein [Fulvivirga imtechensis]ELR68797.1 Manganese ABC transporter, periplasmic-binding protein SitA [Fulvivirga imtechensis AK7]